MTPSYQVLGMLLGRKAPGEGGWGTEWEVGSRAVFSGFEGLSCGVGGLVWDSSGLKAQDLWPAGPSSVAPSSSAIFTYGSHRDLEPPSLTAYHPHSRPNAVLLCHWAILRQVAAISCELGPKAAYSGEFPGLA